MVKFAVFFLYEKKTGEVVIEKVLSFDFTTSRIVSGNFFFFFKKLEFNLILLMIRDIGK